MQALRVGKVLRCAYGLLAAAAIGCGGGGGSPGGGGSDGGAGGGADLATPCSPFGMFMNVRGGISATACGQPLMPFTDGTATITESAGGALLTVANTTSVGDVSDCQATVTTMPGCTAKLTASCIVGNGSVDYTLTLYATDFQGRASVTLPGPGGGCTVPYDIEGSR